MHYVAWRDVDTGALEPTQTETYCPFKGHASYWRLLPHGMITSGVDDVLWSYEDPYVEVAQLQGYVAFYANRVQRIEARVD